MYMTGFYTPSLFPSLDRVLNRPGRLQQYGKHGKSFKIATPARYVIVLSDPKMIKELATTDDRIMSFAATGVERISMAYTFSAEMVKLDYHTALIQKNLTNRLSSILPEIVSELVLSFEENTNIGPGTPSPKLLAGGEPPADTARMDECG